MHIRDGAGAVLPVWRLLSITVIPTEKDDGRRWYSKSYEDDSGEKKRDRPRVTRAALPDSSTIVGLRLNANDAKKFLKVVNQHHPEFGVDETTVMT